MPAIENLREGNVVRLDGAAAARPSRAAGRVVLVGAGPGDPDLLTVKAARWLAAADVVVHDRLVAAPILDLIPQGARRLYVGKRRSAHSVPQSEVNALLISLALAGHDVVRLKGGDPFVFGRGGEELLACRAAGVRCEVVPGITSAQAAAAGAGAPLTHRRVSTAVTFVTGHAVGDLDGEAVEPDVDWSAHARAGATLIVYMGLATAARTADRLILAGRDPATPVLIVENASRPGERRVLTDLLGLAAAAAGFEGPAILMIGETAAYAEVGDPAAALGHALSPCEVVNA